MKSIQDTLKNLQGMLKNSQGMLKKNHVDFNFFFYFNAITHEVSLWIIYT